MVCDKFAVSSKRLRRESIYSSHLQSLKDNYVFQMMIHVNCTSLGEILNQVWH